MHEQWVWMFCEPLQNKTLLSAVGLKIKTDIRSARVRLQTFSNGAIHIVYHLPWALDDLLINQTTNDQTEGLAVWLDFCLDALALKEDYPSRVNLWPIDIYLNKNFEKATQQDAPDRQSLQAFITEQRHPEVFELLERLEMLSYLNGREPFTKINTNKLSVRQLNELALMLNIQQAMHLENKNLKERIQQLDEQQESYHQDLQKFNQRELEMEQSIHGLQNKINEFSNEIKLKTTENTMLIQQLHSLQEKYEQQLLQNQSLQIATTDTVELLQRIKIFVKQKFPDTFLLKQGNE